MEINRVSILTNDWATMNLDVTEYQLQQYETGKLLLQYAFPQLSRAEREFIKSGITPEAWIKAFGSDERTEVNTLPVRMNAFLIDPENKSITVISIDGGLQSIYKSLDCSMIEAPVTFENEDTLFCNENAWMEYDHKKKPCGFMFPDWTYAILGKSLIIGAGEEGESMPVKSNLWDFDNIIWCSANYMQNQGIKMDLI